MRNVRLPKNYRIVRAELQEKLRKHFGDRQMNVVQIDEEPFSESEFQLHLVSPKAFMPERPIAMLQIKRHLGGGSKPVVLLKKVFTVSAETHKGKNVGTAITKLLKQLHQAD